MSAQVGPEHSEVSSLVQLDGEIQKPGSIRAIAMKKDHGRRAFRTANEPAARLRSIMIAPGNIRGLEYRPGYLRKSFRCDAVGSPRWPRDAVRNPNHRGGHRGRHDQNEWQEDSAQASYQSGSS